MRIIIAGTRTFDKYGYLFRECEKFLNGCSVTEIVSGGARGADKLGERYARDKGYPVKVFPADWETHGKSAGYKRNEEMARYANVLIAFWDGSSKGTRHMISAARKRGLIIHVVPTGYAID